MTSEPVPTEQALKYELPRSARQIANNLIDPTPQRVITGTAALLVVISCLVFLPLAAPLFIAIGIFLIMPIKGRHGIDWVLEKQRSWSVKRKGGEVVIQAIQPDDPLSKPSGLKLEEYPVYNRQGANFKLPVISNASTGTHTVVLLVEDWPGVTTGIEEERTNKDQLLADAIERLTAEGFFSRCAMYVVRRSAVDTFARHHIEEMTAGAEDDRLVLELLEDIEEFFEKSSDLTYVFAARTNAPSRQQLKALKGQNKWREIPAVTTFLEVSERLRSIGITVAVPLREELSGLARSIMDPADIHAQEDTARDMLVREGKIEKQPMEEIFGPLSLQHGLDIRTIAHDKSLQCGGSFHAFLGTGKFTTKHIPAGIGFFDLVFNGLTPWCLTSLVVEVEPKNIQLTMAATRRKYRLGKVHSDNQKGKVQTEREARATEEQLRSYDEIDLAEGGYAWYSLAFMISAESEEDLEDLVGFLTREVRKHQLRLRRIEGASLMRDSLHTMLGLK